MGERSAQVRELTAAGLGFLGVAIDESQGASAGADRDVSAELASVRTLVIAAREDLEKFFDAKVFLDLHVRVKSEWREDEGVLNDIGLK